MKVERLISIIMLLLAKRRVGARELAEMFEVSTRTIYRDVDTINLAGIPILSTPGAGGGFEIMQTYKLDKKVFSTGDLSAILMGLSSLSSLIQGDELVNALAKVKSFVPAERERDIELRVNQIRIDISPWLGNRNVQPSLEIIKAALQKNRLLAFEYADRHGIKTARTAEPYQLVLKGGQWYWHGYCQTRRDFRLFRVSRTSNLRLLEECFTPRVHKDPLLDASEAIASLQTPVTLRVHASIKERVLDYGVTEAPTEDGGEHWIVRFPFIENDYYYGILFGFGDKCECMGPPHIREEMKRRAQATASLYD